MKYILLEGLKNLLGNFNNKNTCIMISSINMGSMNLYCGYVQSNSIAISKNKDGINSNFAKWDNKWLINHPFKSIWRLHEHKGQINDFSEFEIDASKSVINLCEQLQQLISIKT